MIKKYQSLINNHITIVNIQREIERLENLKHNIKNKEYKTFEEIKFLESVDETIKKLEGELYELQQL